MIRFVFRWLFRAVILGIVLAVALVLVKDPLAKAVLENRLRAETGLDVKMGNLELGLLTPTVTVSDLRIYNAPEFGGSLLLAAPDLHCEYSRTALAFRRLHFRFVRLNVPTIYIVEGKSGRTNLLLGLPGQDQVASTTRGESLLGLPFTGIDTLNLSLGKLTYTSLRRPGKTTEVELGLENELFTGIQSLAHFRELLTKALFRKGITITTDAPAPARSASSKRPPSPERSAIRGNP